MTSRFPASLRIIGRSIVDWWDGWINMVVVTILWFLAQLTIVLGPPATFGAYHVMHQTINGESTGVSGMIAGIRQYFGKSWVWGGINLLVIIILVVNFAFYGAVQAWWGLYLQIFMGLVTFLYTASVFYGLAYFMEMEQSNVLYALRNGLYTTLAAPFYTIILMILVLIILGLSIFLVIPLFLGLPALVPILAFNGINDRLIAFGLRKPERTPKEIEFEQGSRIDVQGMNLDHFGDNVSRGQKEGLPEERDNTGEEKM